MNSELSDFQNALRTAMRENWKWFVFQGIVMLILGCLAPLALVITVALSSTAALAQPGNQVPTFNINRNCSSEAAEGVDIQSTMANCVRDEADAKKQLDQEWSKLGSDLKRECVGESEIGGDQSYVELLTCLEMSSSQWNGDQTVGQVPSNAERH
jgi:flagellar biosynthesis component FlhA